MAFQKSFPHRTETSAYPNWKEVELTDEEEIAVEDEARRENLKLMAECISDAKQLFDKNDLKDYQSDMISVATALFEKRASHQVYWKEEAAKEKFDEKYKD